MSDCFIKHMTAILEYIAPLKSTFHHDHCNSYQQVQNLVARAPPSKPPLHDQMYIHNCMSGLKEHNNTK